MVQKLRQLKPLMGRITTSLTITNRLDKADAARGYKPAEQIRSITIAEALINTDATTLCLPADLIQQLGLELLREVQVTTAAGVKTARVFQDAFIDLLGRQGTFECLELPGGDVPLIGIIPLEVLGIEIDIQQQSLKLLPMTSSSTYLTIL